MAKSVKSVVKKTEEAFDMPKEKIKDLMCLLVETEILKMKMEEESKDTNEDKNN